MVFLEPADWIGVVLIVLGLALVSAAVVLNKRKGGSRAVSSTLHPELARELSRDDDPVSSSTSDDASEPAIIEPATVSVSHEAGAVHVEPATSQAPRPVQ